MALAAADPHYLSPHKFTLCLKSDTCLQKLQFPYRWFSNRAVLPVRGPRVQIASKEPIIGFQKLRPCGIGSLTVPYWLVCKLRHLSSVHGILKSVGAQEQLVCEKRISGSSSATAAGWSNDVIPRIAIQLLQRRWLRFCTADDTFWWLLKRFFSFKYHGKLERLQCGRIIKCQWKLGFRFVCLLWTCVCPVVWNWVNYASSTEWKY